MAAPGHRRFDGFGKVYQLEGSYAARTVARNLTTSAFRRLFSFESNCADESTWEDAEPVSPAPRLTSAMLVATWVEPMAACCTCLLYTSPSPRDRTRSRLPSSA